jgi:hypothetical protein
MYMQSSCPSGQLMLLHLLSAPLGPCCLVSAADALQRVGDCALSTSTAASDYYDQRIGHRHLMKL